jgi:hypothetical protein
VAGGQVEGVVVGSGKTRHVGVIPESFGWGSYLWVRGRKIFTDKSCLIHLDSRFEKIFNNLFENNLLDKN